MKCADCHPKGIPKSTRSRSSRDESDDAGSLRAGQSRECPIEPQGLCQSRAGHNQARGAQSDFATVRETVPF